MRFVDLSHPISNEMSTYPSDPDISINIDKEIATDRVLLHSFKMGTHTGTHLDAPAHVIDGSKTIDKFSLCSFFGKAVKIDKSSYKGLDKISENINGVIFETGWYQHFDAPDIFYGSDRPNIPNELPKIIKKMNVNFFGCDLPSVDVSGSKNKPIHHSLLTADIIVYESLTNLDQLPLLSPFEFYGFPLPFIGLDGSPVRAVGLI